MRPNLLNNDNWIIAQTSGKNPWIAPWAQLFIGRFSGQGESNEVFFVIPGSPNIIFTDPSPPADADNQTDNDKFWTFYTAVLSSDGTDTVATLYRNGEEVDSATQPGTVYDNPNTSDSLFLGTGGHRSVSSIQRPH